MATQTKFPTFSNTESGGAPEDTEAWASPANIRADDGTESTITAATFDSPDISFWLTGNTFEFTIPAGATIDGIVVEIERSNAVGAASDHRVQFRSAGAFIGDNKADTALDWPTAATIKTYGSSTDDWRPTEAWTPDEINATGFGLTLTVQADAANTDVGVDYIKVTVHYTEPNRRGRVSWAELEVPDAPRRGRVSWAELEVPDFNRRGRVSWAELETPDAPSTDRRGRVSWAEFEVPTFERRARVSWAELEVPTLGDQAVEGVADAVIEIAFASNPADVPVWTDVTDFVVGTGGRRGRQHELDRPEAGTGTLLLDNWDRRFEPLNSGSPYFPNVVPMRRIRIRAAWEGTTYDVFNGFVEDFPLRYDEGGFQEVVEVSIIDASEPLAVAEIVAVYAEEQSGTRITNVLDDAGWPAADRDIDAGSSTMQAATFVDTDEQKALAHLLDVAASELGLFFITRDGKVRFLDRHSFFTAPEDYANQTWGDSGTEFLYEDVVLNFGVENIRNQAKVTRQGGTTQIASDAASQTKYLRRTIPRHGILIVTDNEALDHANYLVSRYKEAEIRASRLDLHPSMDTSQWDEVLSHDIGDRIRVRRRPVAGGTIEQNVYIQGITFDWRPYEWKFTWDLSPVDQAAGFWVLDDAARSELDATTKLGV